MIESARRKRVKRLLRVLSAEIETNPVEVINSFLLEWLAAHDGPVQLLYFLKTYHFIQMPLSTKDIILSPILDSTF